MPRLPASRRRLPRSPRAVTVDFRLTGLATRPFASAQYLPPVWQAADLRTSELVSAPTLDELLRKLLAPPPR